MIRHGAQGTGDKQGLVSAVRDAQELRKRLYGVDQLLAWLCQTITVCGLRVSTKVRSSGTHR
eukprot:COSAG02_NODE_7546_length_2967_cov_4.622309_3_plen_62_part_00